MNRDNKGISKEASRRIIVYLESLGVESGISLDWKDKTIKTLSDYITDEAMAFDVWVAFERLEKNGLNYEVLIKIDSFKYIFHASL